MEIEADSEEDSDFQEKKTNPTAEKPTTPKATKKATKKVSAEALHQQAIGYICNRCLHPGGCDILHPPYRHPLRMLLLLCDASHIAAPPEGGEPT